MLWKELTIGFLIAGFVALLPMDVFNSLFVTGAPGWVQQLENVVVGPIVAILSFVCSIGNVPLAAVLWAGGISFSGVIAFIYADLLIVPILLIYRRYYGGRVTVRLVAIMFTAIVVSALVVNALFSALGAVPTERPSVDSITSRAIAWNYTTALDILFAAVAALLLALTARRVARDPMCGMTVDRSKALRATHDGHTVFFCSDHCRRRFEEVHAQ
jgi:YHS domain-containing protein